MANSSSPDEQAAAGGELADRGYLERLCMRNLLNTPGERVFFKDLQSRFLLLSQTLAEATGHGNAEDLIGKTDFDIFSIEHATEAFEDEQSVILTGEPIVSKVERETYHDKPDAWVSTTKLPLLDDDGQVIGTFGISRDVTAQIMAEQALAHQALHDSVTGLPNRVAVMDRLSQALLALDRARTRVAVLFVDLDNFKLINDTMGHEAGDNVLVEVARRLTKIARRGDTVARFGGDEFVVLCTGLRADDDVRLIASRFVRVLERSFFMEGQEFSVTGSIGVVITDDPATEPGELLQQADIAMYEAKKNGRDGFHVFDPSLYKSPLEYHDFDSSLRRAIEERQLFLLYQPLFSLDDRRLTGAEALVRWQHPRRGVLPPVEFIPLAEKRGLIGAVDNFVLDAACSQLAAWVAEGSCPPGFTVAVNVSGRQLSDPAFVENVRSAISRHRVDPAQLCLEITETALISELGGVSVALRSLSGLGVKLALDDFGTGYSTLVHVQQLNVDILKIDRSFVEQIEGSERDREIIGAITAMAHALGMSVVGEGIETHLQLGELLALGCDQGQGFLLARPLAPEALVELARSGLVEQAFVP